MTPFEIEVLMYYYYSAVDDFPRKSAPIFKGTMQRFIKAGLIIEVSLSHPCTYEYKGNREALKAYVEALAAVPLPKQKWIVEKE